MTEMYEFIDAEYAASAAAPAITKMCAWLEVSKSGFYSWRSRPDSATAKRQRKLALIIGRIFADSDSTYGYRRITEQLARQGTVAGPELVRKLMRQLGLVPLPAEAVAAVHHAAGTGRADPGPGAPELHCGDPGREDGGRHYLYPDLGGLGVPRHGD